MAVCRPLQLSLIITLVLVGLIWLRPVSAEKIDDLQVAASLNADGELSVVETISYNFEDAQSDKAILFIPVLYSYQDHNFYLGIENITVTDQAAKVLTTKSTLQGSELVLTVTDSDRFFSGLVVLKVSYLAKGLINYGLNQDLFYWNVTGNAWPLRIKRSHVTITLPKKVVVDTDQLNCFYGPINKELKCRATVTDDQSEQATFVFTNSFEIFAAESTSATFNLPKGVIKEPSWPEVLKAFVLRNLSFFVPGAIILVILLIWQRGRQRAPEF